MRGDSQARSCENLRVQLPGVTRLAVIFKGRKMNKTLGTQTAIVLACNLFIVIPAGHGIGFLALIEIAVLFFRSYEFTLSINKYEDTFGLASIFSFVGQLVLLGSFFINKQKVFAGLLITALAWLFLGFFFLTFRSLQGETLATISFVTGIPFIISSVILVSKLIKQPLEEESE